MLSQHQGLEKNRFQSECPHQQSVTFSAGEKEKKVPNVKVKNIKGGLARGLENPPVWFAKVQNDFFCFAKLT